MHIQVITFNLEGISRAQYEAACDQFAGMYAELPGLMSKHWLADEKNNTYGGVYIWKTSEACQAYLDSELYSGMGKHPNMTHMESKDYAVLEAPTRVTRGL